MDRGLDFLFEPGSPFLDHLDPLSLIKLLHVNKSARKAAVCKLKEIQASPQTQAHTQMFQQWLRKPSVPDMLRTDAKELVAMLDPNHSRENLEGPFGLEAIQRFSSRLISNTVILSCAKTYDLEQCWVAIFDDDGSFVAIYEFSCEPFVESGACINKCRWGISIRSSADITACRILDPLRARWKMSDVEFFAYDDEGSSWNVDQGDPAGNIYALHQLYLHELSPAEVTMVLMHAFSSNPRVIYCYVHDVFSYMGILIKIDIEIAEKEGNQVVADALRDWRRELCEFVKLH